VRSSTFRLLAVISALISGLYFIYWLNTKDRSPFGQKLSTEQLALNKKIAERRRVVDSLTNVYQNKVVMVCIDPSSREEIKPYVPFYTNMNAVASDTLADSARVTVIGPGLRDAMIKVRSKSGKTGCVSPRNIWEFMFVLKPRALVSLTQDN